MIVDTSALIAILKDEPERSSFEDALLNEPVKMSVATWIEATMVARGLSESHVDALETILEEAMVELVPVSVDQARAARHAHRRYGRGSGSAARLNLGDCFSYALSALTGEPLLFKGDDFAHTDVIPASGRP